MQGVLDVHPVGEVRLHRVVEDNRAVAAIGLGAVGGDVGPPHQFLGGDGAIAGCHHDADAGGDEHRRVADHEGAGEDGVDPIDPLAGVVERAGGTVEDDEVVTTGTRHDAVEAGGDGAQPVGERDEQAIGGVVTERVVDVLESVDVDLDQRGVVLGAPGVLEHVGDVLDEPRPGRQVGELVTVEPADERPLRPPSGIEGDVEPSDDRQHESHRRGCAHGDVGIRGGGDARHEHDRYRQAEDQGSHQDRLVVRSGQHVLGSIDRLEDARHVGVSAGGTQQGKREHEQRVRHVLPVAAGDVGLDERPHRRATESERHRTHHQPHRAVAGQAFEHELGGERDEHDRQRQICGGEHGQCRVHAGIDRRFSERQPRRQPGAGYDGDAVEQLAPASRPRRERSASKTVAMRRTPIVMSASACSQIAGREDAGSSATSTGTRAIRRAVAPSATASSRGASRQGIAAAPATIPSRIRPGRQTTPHPFPRSSPAATPSATATSTHHQPLAASRRVIAVCRPSSLNRNSKRNRRVKSVYVYRPHLQDSVGISSRCQKFCPVPPMARRREGVGGPRRGATVFSMSRTGGCSPA